MIYIIIPYGRVEIHSLLKSITVEGVGEDGRHQILSVKVLSGLKIRTCPGLSRSPGADVWTTNLLTVVYIGCAGLVMVIHLVIAANVVRIEHRTLETVLRSLRL
jgi:hypothetical protein